MTLAESIKSLFDPERYGAGVPVGVLLLGLALLIYGIRGLVMYDSLTSYGKVGVVVIFSSGVVTTVAAGGLFRSMGVAVWKTDRSVKDGANDWVRDGR